MTKENVLSAQELEGQVGICKVEGIEKEPE